MKEICILTDASAQFPLPRFAGSDLLTVIPLRYAIADLKPLLNLSGEQSAAFPETVKAANLPVIAPGSGAPFISPPDVSDFAALFSKLAGQYKTIFGIFLSGCLCPVANKALEAAADFKGKTDIRIIDSLTTSIGLGLIVQKVCEAAHAGAGPDAILHKTRCIIPRLYTLLSTPGLSYLNRNRFLEQTQSIIAEMLGIIPIYTFENGVMTPVEKVSNVRQVMLYYQEFLDEYEKIEHVGFLQSAKPQYNDTKTLFSNAGLRFPGATTSKNLINLPVSLLFGPYTTSLVVLENSLR